MQITNKYIPFKGFKAINICGILFVREGATLTDEDLNHEAIHTEQIYELLIIGFYAWYVLEWLIRFLCCFNSHKAYRNISFEREAYTNENNGEYIFQRRLFNFIKYIV